jgi:hypothetical protein
VTVSAGSVTVCSEVTVVPGLVMVTGTAVVASPEPPSSASSAKPSATPSAPAAITPAAISAIRAALLGPLEPAVVVATVVTCCGAGTRPPPRSACASRR